MTPLVAGWEDIDHGPVGEVGAVLDGLYPGNRLPSLQEHVRLGTQAQLRSLHGLGVPPQRHPEGTHQVPWAAHADASPSPDHPN